jgi:flagellar transcriptional activator FlhD
MNNEQLLAEIRDVNLTYLMLAQTLIRQDRAEAQFRLGLSEEATDLIATLSSAQVLKTASTNILLCRMRVDEGMVWKLLTSHSTPSSTGNSAAKLHASILMAGRFSETLNG